MYRVEVWLTALLLGVGVVGALIYNWPASNSNQEGVNPNASLASNKEGAIEDDGLPSALPSGHDADLPSTSLLQRTTDFSFDAPVPVSLDADDIALGDKFLIVGNYVAAARAYTKVTHRLRGTAPSALLLRLAISQEQMENFEQASRLYQQVIKHSVGQYNNRLLGLSGLARVWIGQEKYGQAAELLSELYLRHGTHDEVPDEIRFQIIYQLSEVVQKQYMELLPKTAGQQDGRQFRTPEFHWCEPNLERVLELAPSVETGVRYVNQTDGIQIKVLQRPTNQIDLIAIDAQTPVIPISKLLYEISQSANLEFDLSPGAHGAVVGRSAKLNVSGMPLSTVVDSLLGPLRLVWQQDEETVRVLHVDDAPELILDFHKQQAVRSLRRIELTLPRSLRRDSSLMHRGNLNLMTGDLKAAEKRFQELKQLTPNGDLAAKLSLNQAMLDLSHGRSTKAIQRLFFSVDQSLDHTIQAKCYGLIARLELEAGNPDRAVYSASRGLSLVTNQSLKQDTVLTLAKSYLLQSNPFMANRVLFDQQDAIYEPPARRLASVLSAYARLIGKPSGEGLQDESSRLVIALSSIVAEDTRHFIDALVVGRAYFEVGFTSQSTRLMQWALENSTSEYWNRKIGFELGIHLQRDGELEAAADAFSKIAQVLDDEIGIASQTKWAEIALTVGRSEEGLELCKQLWGQSLNEQQKKDTLALMGQAYQQLGQHHAAAICFSGMVPHRSTSGNPNDVIKQVKQP